MADKRETLPQLQKISKLPVPDTDSLDEDIQKYIRVCEEKLGMVPTSSAPRRCGRSRCAPSSANTIS